VWIAEEANLGRDVLLGEQLVECCAGRVAGDGVGEEADEANHDPVHLDARVPVEAAVEGGTEFSVPRVRAGSRGDEERHSGVFADDVGEGDLHVVGGKSAQDDRTMFPIERHRLLRAMLDLIGERFAVGR
jgi:hypothetical protein